MPNPFIESNIRSLPMFARLPPDQIGVLADYVDVMRAEAGDILFRQGQPARGMYYFVSGSAKLMQIGVDGLERQLAIIGANQYLNDAALIRSSNEAASLRVLETSIILFISREKLALAVTDHPELRANLPANIVPTPSVAPPPAIPTAANKDKEKIFEEQRDNETILIDTRRHRWAYVRRAWLPALVALGILIFAFTLPSFWLSLAVFGIGMIIPGLLMLYFYFEWRNDHVIVTDQRIIRIERTIPTFQTIVSEVPIGSIQEINTEFVTPDPFSRVFDFGTVDLKTSGDAGNLRLTMIPEPKNFQKRIFENRERHQQAISRQQRNVIRSEIDSIVSGGGAGTGKKPAAQAEKMVYRKHVIYRFRLMLLPALLVVFAFGLFIFSLVTQTPVLLLVAVLFALFGAGWLYWTDWDWRNDMYIVGVDTIQIIHKRPLWLQNESDQIAMSKIDSVVSDQSGLLQSIFDYGNVKISLVGGDPGSEKVFRAVGSPQEVQAEIARRQQQLRNRSAAEAERRRRSEIAEYLSVYHETVGTTNPAEGPSVPDPTPQKPIPEARRITPTQPNSTPPIPQVRDRTRPPNVPKTRSDGK